MPLDD